MTRRVSQNDASESWIVDIINVIGSLLLTVLERAETLAYHSKVQAMVSLFYNVHADMSTISDILIAAKGTVIAD